MVLLRVRPPHRIEMRHPTFNARITVEPGNLLDETDGVIVITTNRNYDTSVEWVSELSLIAQLSARWYGVDGEQKLDQAIAIALGTDSVVEQPVGTVVELSHGGQRALLLAVAQRHEETRSAVVAHDIWVALTGLWRHIRATNTSKVYVPVIGSGFARAQVGQVPLLMLLLTAYVTASMGAVGGTAGDPCSNPQDSTPGIIRGGPQLLREPGLHRRPPGLSHSVPHRSMIERSMNMIITSVL